MQSHCAPLAADVVIVGASFGGAACALAAAQRGLRVCVLERKTDPGEKIRTTGILVKEAAENTLMQRIPSAMTRRIEQVRLYSPGLKQLDLAVAGVGRTLYLVGADGARSRVARRCVTTRRRRAFPISMDSCCTPVAWADCRARLNPDLPEPA